MKTLQELNNLSQKIYQQNYKNWWCDADGKPLKDRNKPELLMLTISEIAEGMEGVRKNLPDDKLPHRSMEEVEMADTAIRIFDLAGGFQHTFTDRSTFIYAFVNKAEWMFNICKYLCKSELILEHLDFALYSIIGYCDYHELDFWGVVEEKLEFNKTRADHKHEVRQKEGGKRF